MASTNGFYAQQQSLVETQHQIGTLTPVHEAGRRLIGRHEIHDFHTREAIVLFIFNDKVILRAAKRQFEIDLKGLTFYKFRVTEKFLPIYGLMLYGKDGLWCNFRCLNGNRMIVEIERQLRDVMKMKGEKDLLSVWNPDEAVDVERDERGEAIGEAVKVKVVTEYDIGREKGAKGSWKASTPRTQTFIKAKQIRKGKKIQAAKSRMRSHMEGIMEENAVNDGQALQNVNEKVIARRSESYLVTESKMKTYTKKGRSQKISDDAAAPIVNKEEDEKGVEYQRQTPTIANEHFGSRLRRWFKRTESSNSRSI